MATRAEEERHHHGRRNGYPQERERHSTWLSWQARRRERHDENDVSLGLHTSRRWSSRWSARATTTTTTTTETTTTMTTTMILGRRYPERIRATMDDDLSRRSADGRARDTITHDARRFSSFSLPLISLGLFFSPIPSFPSSVGLLRGQGRQKIADRARQLSLPGRPVSASLNPVEPRRTSHHSVPSSR